MHEPDDVGFDRHVDRDGFSSTAGASGCASPSDSSRSVRRAPSTTATPSRASASAHASPMPDEAPVMAATRPANVILTDDDDDTVSSRRSTSVESQSPVGGRQSTVAVDSSVASRESPLPAQERSDCRHADCRLRLDDRLDCRLLTDPMDPSLTLLRDLVAIDSVNPSLVPGAKGEGVAAEAVAAHMRKLGLDVESGSRAGRVRTSSACSTGHPPGAR